MPRRPFTQREHLGAGALISQAQNDLTSVALAVQEAYGLTAGRPLLRLNGTTARDVPSPDSRGHLGRQAPFVKPCLHFLCTGRRIRRLFCSNHWLLQ